MTGVLGVLAMDQHELEADLATILALQMAETNVSEPEFKMASAVSH